MYVTMPIHCKILLECLSEQSTVLISDSIDTSQQQQKDESQERKACFLQDELCLASHSLQLLFPDVTEDTEVVPNILSGSSYDHLGLTEENIISHEGLRCIAGYIAYHTKNKYNLGAHTFKIKPEDGNIMQSQIMCLSSGGLTDPDENFFKYCYTMESAFQTYHGPNDSSMMP
jgi:hypothetical protein